MKDVVQSEANKKYAIMSGDCIKRRETMERFLKMVGMTHSQEEILIDSERLVSIGDELKKCEKELREGLGLRKTERKSEEWAIANTIDLIKVILDNWSCVKVESIIKKKKVNKKTIREYTLKINECNTIWNKIINSNVNYDENILRL